MEKDLTKCYHTTEERSLKAPEDRIGKMQQKGGEEWCHEGDACHATYSKR